MDRRVRASDFRHYYESQKKTRKRYSKKDACEEYLNLHGSITPLEALTAFGSMRLAAIISELRNEGMEIATAMHYDRGTSYAEYVYER